MRLTDKPSDPPVDSNPPEEPGGLLGGLVKGLADLVGGGLPGLPGGLPLPGLSDGVDALVGQDGELFGEKKREEPPTSDKQPPRQPATRQAVAGDITLAEGSVGGRSSVVYNEGSFGSPGGAVQGRGSVEALGVSGSAHGSAGVNLAQGQAYAQGSAEARATLFRAEGEVHAKYGDLEAHARGEVFAGARANAQGAVVADARTGTIRAGGKAEAFVGAEAKGEAHAKYGDAEAHVRGEAFAGARARAEGDLVFDPSKGEVQAGVKGDAFAGAAATAEGSVSAGGVEATGGAHAYAGVGVHFEASAGYDDGKLNVKFDVGAALGVGTGFKFDVTLDIPKLADTAASFVPGAKVAFEIAEGLGGLFGLGKGGGGGGLFGAIGGLFGGGGGDGAKGAAGPDAPPSTVPFDINNPLFPGGADPNQDPEKNRRKERPVSLEESRARDKLGWQWSGGSEERTELPPIKGEKEIS